MNPLQGMEIRGTWATLLTPVEDDDSIGWSRLYDEIAALLASGVDGIYSNGTAGEFYTQTEEEFDRLSYMLAEACERAAMPFQIGASHTSPQTALDRVRRARQLRPSAIQVILPDWYPTTSAEARRFLERVAEAASPIGLVLYNPPHAKRELAPAEFGEISAAVPELAGVKVAHSDAGWCRAFREAAPRVSLFVPGHQLATGIRNGAHGSYSNVACLHPAGAKRWNRLMASEPERALEIEARIQRFQAQHILPYRTLHGIGNMGLDKLMAAVGGWAPVGTRLRWPYSWVPEEEAARLRPVAHTMIPELFAPV